MSIIHIRHHHGLKREETRTRLDHLAREIKARYQVNYVWRGNRLLSQHKGSMVSVHLGEGVIELSIKLGLMFAPMKGRIESTIRQNLHGVISGRKDLLAHPALNR